MWEADRKYRRELGSRLKVEQRVVGSRTEKGTGSKRGVGSRLKAKQRMVNRTEGKKGGGRHQTGKGKEPWAWTQTHKSQRNIQ
jgi:hypothetical protein